MREREREEGRQGGRKEGERKKSTLDPLRGEPDLVLVSGKFMLYLIFQSGVERMPENAPVFSNFHNSQLRREVAYQEYLI